MDETSKKLLGTATVAVASLGLASLPGYVASQGRTLAPFGNVAPDASGPASDPLVELMLRTRGSQSAVALKHHLRQMLSYITPERMTQMPALVRGLRTLGLGSDVEEDVLTTVVQLLAETELPMSDEQIEALAAAFAAEPERAVLATSGPPGRSGASEEGGTRGIGLYGG